MDYEKKYKEALGWMQSLYDGLHGATKEDAEHYFPELKESEDEESKKWILEYLHDGLRKSDEQFKDYFKTAIAWLKKQGEKDKLIKELGEYKVKYTQEVLESHINSMSIKEKAHQIAWETSKHYDPNACKQEWCEMAAIDMADWIEKQGEQKTTDKVEPKFQIGDWVIFDNNHNSLYRIEDIENYQYFLRHYLGGSMALGFCNEDDLRLWTFKDATEGDILINVENKFPFIYKGRLDPSHPDSPVAYCGINTSGRFYICQLGTNFWWTDAEVQPATKRQRDTLIEMMTEEGYVFDFNKKELKKMDQLTQKKEVKDTAKNITTELLEKNGFEFSHERCEGFECYYRGFDSKVDVDLIHYENPDTDWELTIMFKDSKEELVKVISTIDELQQCIDVMNLDIKIKM